MNTPRFSLPEIIIIFIIVGAIDAVDFLITIVSAAVIAIGGAFGFITFGVSIGVAAAMAGALEGVAKPLINFVSTALIQFYLFMKGVRGLHYLGGALAEFIPIFNVLPMRTASMALLIAITNKRADLNKIKEAPADDTEIGEYALAETA